MSSIVNNVSASETDLTLIQLSAMTNSNDERNFFAGLGERAAQARNTRNITLVQLAQALALSQQTIQAYKMGRRRIAVSMLRLLAKMLGVKLDELLADGEPSPHKCGPVSQLQQHLRRISQLPNPKPRMIMQMIDALLQQQGR